MQPYHDTYLRYHTIDRELQSAGVRGRVLEVGCGSWGLAAWHPRLSVIGVDMRFAEARVANLIPLVADATRLPFPDGAFEAVVSSDMLEHIPPVNRRAAVEELIRVASRILVLGVPVGARAARQDQEMADYQRRRGETVDPMIADADGNDGNLSVDRSLIKSEGDPEFQSPRQKAVDVLYPGEAGTPDRGSRGPRLLRDLACPPYAPVVTYRRLL
jgi:SAM-dependent methyltransferase